MTSSVDTNALLQRAIKFQSTTPRPFLRWAGSKRSLLKHLVPLIPTRFERYIEPFLGSGSMFFILRPTTALLNDSNVHLISTYRAVRDSPNSVARHYKTFDVLDREQYYKIRAAALPANRFERAARFLYLNRACWNGLYRVNQSGFFNVPYGAPKTSSPLDEFNLSQCAETLSSKHVQLSHTDFALPIEDARSGDLMYLDPPYVTTHNQNGFLDYNKKIFSWRDQQRLAELARKAVDRGARVIVSNASHESVRELYRGFTVVPITRKSTLASSVQARSVVSETIYWAES